VLYVGSQDGVERDLATRAGLEYRAIDTGQLRGGSPRRVFRGLAQMQRGLRQSRQILIDFQPEVLFVSGGYVCVPLVRAAHRAGVPVLIFLPDMTPGLAIRTLRRYASRVAVTTEETVEHFGSKAVVTGYPVRRELIESLGSKTEARRQLGLDLHRKTLLVFGGSRGARSINRALMGYLPQLLDMCQVIHVSGRRDWGEIESFLATSNSELLIGYHPFAYLHQQMALALGAADLVVSRAGAAILGEYTVLGLPSLLVPYPHAGRHQYANARYLHEAGAASILDDEDLSAGLLMTVSDLLSDSKDLASMSASARALAKPDAAQHIAEILGDLATGNRSGTDGAQGELS